MVDGQVQDGQDFQLMVTFCLDGNAWRIKEIEGEAAPEGKQEGGEVGAAYQQAMKGQDADAT